LKIYRYNIKGAKARLTEDLALVHCSRHGAQRIHTAALKLWI
jgi:hypothetical protein